MARREHSPQSSTSNAVGGTRSINPENYNLPSVPTNITSSHFGSGHQHIATGGSTQNNNTGNGYQIIQSTIKKAVFVQGESKDTQLLKDLRETDPRDDKTRIEATKGGLLRDSYRWILDHDDFQQWRDNPQSQLLWIKGDPGKGKTMLLCGIIDELKKERGNRLSYFFCKATEAQLSNATAVLRGLIYLVLVQQPSLISHVREKHDHAGKQLFEDTNAWYALREIFIAILEDPALNSIIIIIDALDECVTGLPELLKFIIEQSPLTSRVKWIVSSRNQLAIEEKLDNVEQKIRLQLESNKDLITEAVDTYIEYKVDQLAREKKYDKETRDAVQRHLVGNADGTFLWVALVCQELADPKVRKRHTLDTLKSFPPGLDPLYERMMEHISDSKDAAYCKEILAIASVVCRPITLDELKALAESLEELDQDELKEIIKACGSFLTLREDVIYFVHQSARDYLSEQAASTVFPSGRAVAHCGVFRQSLVAMRKYLRRDIYNLAHPGISIDDIRTPLPDPLAPVRYSCVYWVDHLRDSKPVDSMATDAFIRDKFLHWLEALSVMKKLPDGASALQKLASLYREFSPVATTLHRDSLQRQSPTSASDALSFLMDAIRFLLTFGSIIAKYLLQIYGTALAFCPKKLPDGASALQKLASLYREFSPVATTLHRDSLQRQSPTSASDALSFLMDAIRFLSTFGSTIAKYPLQIYGTALAFCPRSSKVRVKFWNEQHSLKDVRGIQQWGPLLHSFEAHTGMAVSMSFSPNSNTLASSSADKTVRLWNVTAGTSTHTLRGHNALVKAVTFSPNGNLVASASFDCTVRIWEVATGQCRSILEGHTQYVQSVAFSPDGCAIASASDDGTVRIWDTATGSCQRILDGYSDSIGKVTFSTKSNVVVSDLHAGKVRIWKDTMLFLEFEGNEFGETAFSSDAKLFAAVLNDNSVRVTCTATGKADIIPRSDGCVVCSVAFSPKSNLVAMGLSDHTVQIWQNGKLFRIYRNHRGHASSITFSFDGSSIASGSEDYSIQLWDVALCTSNQTPEDHSDMVWSVAFSPNGTVAASGSADKTIRLWNVTAGTSTHTLRGHNALVKAVTFSPNGNLVASASFDCTVRIWEVATGQCRSILEGHTQYVQSVAFSPDGCAIASASNDGTVRLWDTASGTCRLIFDGYPHPVDKISFSPNDTVIASASSIGAIYTLNAGIVRSKSELDGSGTWLLPTSYDSSNVRRVSVDNTMLSKGGNSEGRGISGSDCPLLDGQNNWNENRETEEWITMHGQKILFRPANYRATCIATHGERMMQGHRSGKVTFLEFTRPG